MNSGSTLPTNIVMTVLVGFLIAFLASVLIGICKNPADVKCRLSSGPCYGNVANVDFKKENVDVFVNCPNGRIGFIHTNDGENPIIFKTGTDTSIIWAYRFENDSCSMVRIHGLSDFKLNETYRQIEFRSSSSTETGYIFLTKNYDFKYLCLDPW